MNPHRVVITALSILLFIWSFGVSPLCASSPGIPPAEYSARRLALATSLDSNCIVIMREADYKMRSNDTEYRYRQESNFLYLTGLKSPGNYIILSALSVIIDGKPVRSLIFLNNPGDSTGIRLAGDEIILPAKRFSEIFRSILPGIKTLYLSAPDLSFVNDWVNDKKIFLDKNVKKELEQQFPGLKVKNALPLFGKFREIKSNAELELMRKAMELTGKGLERAFINCAPGKFEYELQADIEYEMIRGGAEYTGFPSIVGSGLNSLILHYDDNNRQMNAGDVVVMDVGAEYAGYSADITRTIPVSGKFTPAQKEIYETVLRAQKAIIGSIRAGVPMRDLDSKAKEVLTQAGYKKYIQHGVSHPVGIDVHDIWASDTLKSGMVVTVEPGLYIPADADSIAEEYRGFGIRIEDDVLVTDSGCEVLTKAVPKEISDIEQIMRKKLNPFSPN
jgi:Xaa-Pro aminopeptidase